MAEPRPGEVCTLIAVCLFLFTSNIGRASSRVQGSSEPSFTCRQVEEFFEGHLGSPGSLLSNPQPESERSVCGRAPQGGAVSCCSLQSEAHFLNVTQRRLKEKIRQHHHAFHRHLHTLLTSYQERLERLNLEAVNRTLVSLTRLHKIPAARHEPLVLNLFSALRGAVVSGGDGGRGVEDAVRDFFTNLFPPVFNFVLSLQGQGSVTPISAEYEACLRRYAEQIQPFGNEPERLSRRLKQGLRHASSLQAALHTFLTTLAATQALRMEPSCQHALLRMQVCPGCRGVTLQGSVVKPCRGMCVNVMRGCLAKAMEISSSWDDLVLAFENLQVGMAGQHELQRMLMYVDMNVSDAIMMATQDTARIYDEVKVKCHNVPKEAGGEAGAPLPLMPDVDTPIPPRSAHELQAFQQQMKAVIRLLQDSKGSLNRLADSLCQDTHLYSQDMHSTQCWNGSAVDRYMAEVPEANFMSQVLRNKEVAVNLMDPHFHFLNVKENLIHMRRNLSGLLNVDVMLSDGPRTPYKNVAGQEGSGGHYSRRHEVIIDDEDLVAYGSGSGSGSGDGSDGDDSNRTPNPGTQRPVPRPTPPSGQSRVSATSSLLLSCCLLLYSLSPLPH